MVAQWVSSSRKVKTLERWYQKLSADLYLRLSSMETRLNTLEQEKGAGESKAGEAEQFEQINAGEAEPKTASAHGLETHAPEKPRSAIPSAGHFKPQNLDEAVAEESKPGATSPVALPTAGAPPNTHGAPAIAASAGTVQPPPRPKPPAHVMMPESPAAPPLPPRREPKPPPLSGVRSDDRASKPSFDLEQWLGVRGAAVLGGIVLALAGIYLFKYSIEKKLLAPPLRVALGGVTGLSCLVASAWLRRRTFILPANGLVGGGLVMLYGSIWAAHSLYELIHPMVAFGLLVIVTGVCGFLSLRHQSRFIAMLGLLGGFATPVMVSTGNGRLLELFGYLFLLNIGVFALAKKLQQPVLAYLSMAATALYQILSFAAYQDHLSSELLLGIFVVFGLLYLGSGYLLDQQEGPWKKLRAWGGGLALLFTSILILDDFTVAPLALIASVLCLSIAACWIAYRLEDGTVVRACSLGAAICLWTWALRTQWPAEKAWQLVMAGVLVAGVYSLFLLLARKNDSATDRLQGFGFAFFTAAISGQVLLVVGSLQMAQSYFWVWLCGWGLLALLVWIHTRSGGFPFANMWFGLGFGASYSVFYLEKASQGPLPFLEWFMGALVVTGLMIYLIPFTLPNDRAKAWIYRGGALFGILLLFAFGMSPEIEKSPQLVMIFLLSLTVVGVYGAIRSHNSWLFGGVLVASTFAFSLTVDSPVVIINWWVGAVTAGLWALVFSLVPVLVKGSIREQRLTWVVASLAPLIGFIWSWTLFDGNLYGLEGLSVLPFVLILVAGIVFLGQMARTDGSWHTFSRAWFVSVAMFLITIGLAIQFEKSTLTIALTAQAFALLFLWKRLGYHELVTGVFLLFGTVFLRLVANPFILDYYPNSTGRIFTWLMATYLIPCGAFLVASRELRKRQPATSLRRFKGTFVDWSTAFYSVAMAFGVVVMMFVYLNLAVLQYFDGGSIELNFARQPARDLTLSMVWAIYGLVLMALGIRNRSKTLRHISLGMVILTICKVFLYDLGELTDLYRAASLFGLALSLLAVSVAYQKFVAGGRLENPEPQPPPLPNSPPPLERASAIEGEFPHQPKQSMRDRASQSEGSSEP